MSDSFLEPSADELSVLVGGNEREPERLLLVGRPRGGRVRVREWESTDWSLPPVSRDYDAAALLAELEQARRSGRSLNQELHALRRWLAATG